MTDRSNIETIATWLLAAAAFLVPLLHSGAISEPFFLPKMLVIAVVAITLGVMALASYLYTNLRPGLTSPVLWLALGVTLLSTVAVGAAANRALALWGLLDVVSGLLILWGVARFVRERAQVGLIFASYLCSASLAASGGLIQVFMPGAHIEFPGGISILPPSLGGSTLGDPGLLAECLILALPIGVGAALLSSGWRRVACGAGIGMVIACLIFTGRPEGWVAALLTAGLLIVTRVVQALQSDRGLRTLLPDPGSDSTRALLAALIVVILIGSLSRWATLSPTGGPTTTLDKTTLLSPTTGDPEQDRAGATRGTIAMLRTHPMGVGPNNWRFAFLQFAWTEIDPSPFSLSHQAIHCGNNFLEVTAETGIIGGLAFFVLVLMILVQAALASRDAPPPWSSIGYVSFNAVAAVVFMALLGAPFEEPTPALIFWMSAGLIQAALAHAPQPAGRLSLLWAEAREPIPIRLRRRRIGFAAGVAGLVLIGWIGWSVCNRLRAAHHVLYAQAAYSAGQFEEAARRLSLPVLASSPDPIHRVRAGSSYLRLGSPRRAVIEFTATLERAPFFLAAYMGRALAYEQLGRYDFAEEDLDRASAIWPDNIETLMSRARLNTTRGRLDDAIQNYMDVAQRETEMAEPFFRAGMIYLRRSQLDEAIQAFRMGRQKDPRYPRLALHLGDALYRKGLIEMALRQFQTAAGQDPGNVEARLKIANTHHALGDGCRALEALEAARELEADTARRGQILDLIEQVRPDCDR